MYFIVIVYFYNFSDPGWSGVNWVPQEIPFTANPGPCNAAADLESTDPVDFVSLFLTDELLERVVEQTNLYADQCIQAVTPELRHGKVQKYWYQNVLVTKVFK